MTKTWAPTGETFLPLVVVAEAPTNCTVPKSQKGTSAPLFMKSSTIHSAFCRQSGELEVNFSPTTWPVVWFSITTIPFVLEFAVIVSWITSPALMVMSLKLTASAGYHSYQASAREYSRKKKYQTTYHCTRGLHLGCSRRCQPARSQIRTCRHRCRPTRMHRHQDLRE